MKRRVFAILGLVGLLCVGVAWAATSEPREAALVAARPAAMETSFVELSPNVPLMPGRLDLFGYETRKHATSMPVLSPDKTQLAATELYFMPSRYQTYARLLLFPVGAEPTLAQILPPERVAQVEAEAQAHPTTDPAFTPSVSLSDVNPQPFWDRYQPEKQQAHRQVLIEAGFDSKDPYRFEALQLVDWSADGGRLLLIHQTGVHHMGIRKTVSVLYDLSRAEVLRLVMLPSLVWEDYLRRQPVMRASQRRVWDVRPLGWSREEPEAMVVKLVLFERQSEVTAGFWTYRPEVSQLRYLGNAISPDAIAQNGWLVRFRDPNAPGGPHTYAPGETPSPAQVASPATPRTWRDRLRFWQK